MHSQVKVLNQYNNALCIMKCTIFTDITLGLFQRIWLMLVDRIKKINIIFGRSLEQ